jgi:molybdopterin-guanine dinucleotide biosynthesis protein MobB
MQPVFCLIPSRLQADLETYLKQGDRKIDLWFKRHKLAIVDFSDQADNFINFNTPQDVIDSPKRVESSIPLLGFSAFSGTGKTTLLTQLIPALNKKNIRVAVIKHAHHQFDVDVPGKDSYKIREAGSRQTLVASSRLLALMQTMEEDPKLAELIPRIDPEIVDIILVEGFKQEQFAKIELHRPSLGKPILYTQDHTVIAIASDTSIELERDIDQLDINNITAIADYIDRFIENWTP